MMMKTKLAGAIAMAMTGTALSVGGMSTANAAATTMYNLTTAAAADNSTNTTNPTTGGVWALWNNNTDGWIYEDPNAFTGATHNPNPGANGTNSVAKWAGTTGQHHTPFGYRGAHLNWAAHFTGHGSAEISTFDAFNRYGVYADIDAAQGAWADNALGGSAGWRHDLDVGLFKSDVSGPVTLTARGILNSTNTDYGFTIFKGMSTNSSYNHHGPAWNAGNNTQPGAPTTASLLGGGTTFTVADIVAYSIGGSTPSNIGSITFNADAGQIYTIALGGFKTGQWSITRDGYQLGITQVPVPAAVWLFGGALSTLIGVHRRKRVVPA
jgi:hypothetical protein